MTECKCAETLDLPNLHYADCPRLEELFAEEDD
jgi:hypothetical protein